MSASRMSARCWFSLLVIVIGAACLPLTGAAWQPAPAMTMHFINVGQADCTLLEFPCGAVLVDAGAQDTTHQAHLIAYLNSFFARRTDLNRTLDAVIITHAHIDHTRALREIAETFTIKHYVDSGLREHMGGTNCRWICQQIDQGLVPTQRREVLDNDITALPDRLGLTDQHIDPVRCADCDPQIRVLSGQLPEDPGWEPGAFGNYNNHSLVVRVDFGAASVLITGDLEEPAIDTLLDWYDQTQMLDVDVYHVGHHGSGNGTTMSLLEEMKPDIAVISMGQWNFGRKPYNKAEPFSTFAYGHPRVAILEMLRAVIQSNRSSPVTIYAAVGARRFQSYTVRKRIYGTGWDGDITIRATTSRSYRVTRSN